VCGRLEVGNLDGSTIQGTCFFYSKSFYMLTCHHLVEKASTLSVSFPSRNLLNIPAVLVASYEPFDLACILLVGHETCNHSLPYLQLSGQASPGSGIFVRGFRADQGDKLFHVTKGQITSFRDPSKVVANCTSDNGLLGAPAIGRGMRDLFGIVRGNFGQTHSSTELIPTTRILDFLTMCGQAIPVKAEVYVGRELRV
jgi:S1-C subfamily serine protease